MLGWTVREPAWLAAPPLPVATLLVGVGTRRAVGAGRVRSVPTRLSALPRLLAGRLRPDVAVVGGVADGRGWRTLASPGWAAAAARHAAAVVVERWPDDAAPSGPTVPITGHVVEVVERADPPDPVQQAVPGPVERAIAASVATLVPDGATVQWGPGALGVAFVDALDTPVRVHSGVVTDELVGLAARGLLIGPATAAYVWGGPQLADLHRRGQLVVAPVEVTHDVVAIGATPRFVAVNTALEVGLDGSVNVEMAKGRVVSGPGGHPDFCLGASRSPGGCSVIAVRAGDPARPGIVVRPAVVSTPHLDVDVVVTEHGVADLRGLDAGARAEGLIAIAAPACRDGLRVGAGLHT